VPIAVYPVNQYNNNLSFLKADTTTLDFQFAEGFYTPSDIVTYFNANNGASFIMTYDSSTFKFSIDESTPQNWTFVTTSNSAYNILGFTATFASANPQTGASPVNLSGPRDIDFITNKTFLNYAPTQQGQIVASSSLFRYPIDGTFGDILTIEPQTETWLECATLGLTDLQVFLKDSDGNPYKLPPNQWFNMFLEINIID